MRRLLKYLKPYRAIIALSIVLLFVQAMCDLALPDLMSRIVNYGIQGAGITEAAPAAIRQSEMNRVLVFLSAEDGRRVLDDYVLVDRNSSAYDALAAYYPGLANGPAYIRKSISEAETAWLEPVFGKALLITGNLEQMLADPAKAAAAGKASGIDLSRVPREPTSLRCSASCRPARRTRS